MKNLMLAAIVAVAVCGCSTTYKGGCVTDGTQFIAGIKPTSTGSFSLSLVEYLCGFVFKWEAASIVSVDRTTEEHWDFIGCFSGENKTHTITTLAPASTEPEPPAPNGEESADK